MIQRSLALLVLLWAPQTAQRNARAQTQVGPVVIGDTVQLQSNTLKESRTLLIAKPAGYGNGTDRYPVLYLLDGETHFRYTVAIVDFLAANDRIPKMLIVGIASGDSRKRTHDLTPPSTSVSDNRFSPGNGGADAFLSFLAGELIPYVDQTYRTRPYRLLAGHSFGGLFAIYALITKPKLFNGFRPDDDCSVHRRAFSPSRNCSRSRRQRWIMSCEVVLRKIQTRAGRRRTMFWSS